MSQLNADENEVDLGEIFASVWAYWWLVFIFATVTTSASIYYVVNRVSPEYTASVRFEINENSSSRGIQLEGLGAVAALAGVNVGSSQTHIGSMRERVLSRDFIEAIYAEANFGNDRVFNKFVDGFQQEVSLKTRLRWLILGKQEVQLPDADDFHVMAVESLGKRLEIDPGESGVSKLTIEHPDAERASEIANLIVGTYLENLSERSRAETRKNLNHYASQLLQVRSELDAASAAVRDFALLNNLQSTEDFALSSSQLGFVRDELNEIEAMIDAIELIDVENFDGPKVVLVNPVTANLNFRRALNLPSNPSDWVAPSASTISSALKRFESQRTGLVATLTQLEEEARASGNASLELAALEREVKVQQTVYEAIITQFESQSLVSSIESKSGEIIEWAIAPNFPSSPNKKLAVALSLVLGIFLGAVVAVIVSARRGAMHRYATISANFKNSIVRFLGSGLLRRVGDGELNEKQRNHFQDLLASLLQKTPTVCLIASDIERLGGLLCFGLAKCAKAIGYDTAVLNLSSEGQRGNTFEDKASHQMDNELIYSEDRYGLPTYQINSDPGFLKSGNAQQILTSLSERHDLVFVNCSLTPKGLARTRLASSLVDSSVLMVQRGKSKKNRVNEFKAMMSSTESKIPLIVVV